MTCVTQIAEFDSAITVYLKFSNLIKSKTRSNKKRVLSQDMTRTGILKPYQKHTQITVTYINKFKQLGFKMDHRISNYL